MALTLAGGGWRFAVPNHKPHDPALVVDYPDGGSVMSPIKVAMATKGSLYRNLGADTMQAEWTNGAAKAPRRAVVAKALRAWRLNGSHPKAA